MGDIPILMFAYVLFWGPAKEAPNRKGPRFDP